MGTYKRRLHHELPAVLREINSLMSGMRISVEHAFGKVMMLCSFNGFKNDFKVGLSMVGSFFILECLLANVHSCLRSNHTAARSSRVWVVLQRSNSPVTRVAARC